MEWQDFGQTVSLTTRLRELLRDYPASTSIFKELVQNADDARATEISLCLDQRSHGTSSLAFPELAPFQGPALLAYNDATFTEADFTSIRHIGDSVKKAQVGKTGRFGLGFNSSYHVTEIPTFVSGRYLCMFDPAAKYLPGAASNPGKRVDFVAGGFAAAHPDSAAPMRAFGCDMKNPFNGTLFRFALRTPEVAAASTISQQVYTPQRMRELLAELEAEAHLVLLFLKNLERIKIYEWLPGHAEPSLLFHCHLKNTTPALRLERSMFARAAAAVADGCTDSSDLAAALQQRPLVTSQFTLEIDSGSRGTARYLVAQGCAGTGTPAWRLAAGISAEMGATLVPWAAVALPLDAPDNEEGRLFCFLPLPAPSGLPAHVNATFELSSNRRDLWHGSDMMGLGRQRAAWNALLLSDIAAPLYASLLAAAAPMLGPAPAFYRCWPPSLEALRAKDSVAAFVDPWLRAIAAAPVAYTETGGGRWLAPQDAVFLDDRSAGDKDLTAALLALGLPVASAPKHILHLFVREAVAAPQILVPAAVRAAVRRAGTSPPALGPGPAAALLDFAASDVLEDDAESVAELDGAGLVPLLRGGLTRLGAVPLFLPRGPEATLFISAGSYIIHADVLRPETLQKLTVIARNGWLNVRTIDVAAAAALLQHALPAGFKGQRRVSWEQGLDAEPAVDWIEGFWEWLSAQPDGSSAVSAALAAWPLVPVRSEALVAPKSLDTSVLIAAWAPGADETMLCALGKLGCEVATIELPPGVAHAADGFGALRALSNSFKRMLPGDAERWFSAARVTVEERDALRAFLLQPQWFANALTLIDFARALPIYPAASGAGFVDLRSQRCLLPPDLHADVAACQAVLGDASLLRSCGRAADGLLLERFGVRQLSKPEFYRRHALAALPLHPALAVQVLRELPILQQQDPAIVEALAKAPLVTTAGGTQRRAAELYDPRNADLVLLLDPVESFPSGEFGAVLDQLRTLGMRATAGRDTVLTAARDVATLGEREPAAAASRARALLAYLDMEAPRLATPAPTSKRNGSNGSGGGGNPFELVDSMFSRVASFLGGPTASPAAPSDETPEAAQARRAAAKEVSDFWAALRSVAWCPVLEAPPMEGMPWVKALGPTAAPEAMRLRSEAWLAGSQRVILDGEPRSPELLRHMGWAAPPEPAILARQLAALGTAFQAPVEDSTARQRLAEVAPQLYRALAQAPPVALEQVKSLLGDAPCVWVGLGFAPLHLVALQGPLNLASAGVFVIPLELAPFRDLLLALGVPASFSADQYVGVLRAAHDMVAGRPLEAATLGQALGVAAALADAGLPASATLYLPDDSGIMREASQLLYNDAPWTSRAPPSDDTFFVHRAISNDVAERLGVSSLQRSLLVNNADALSLALTGAAVEAFGQSEALTTRLRHILEAYPAGAGVLFELLQNGDDAGATTARFLLDRSQWGTERVLGSRMAGLQGPALVAWNDAPMSASDIRNIASIGQDSKLSRPGATGRFGLGFSSVFSYTDVPSFVSGDQLVIFDPHAAFLPGVTAAQPGVKIRFPGSPLLRHFPESFQPYALFGCDLLAGQRYNATLFRLPLRTAEAAVASQIRPVAVTPDDVEALFEDFKAQAAHVLLFLKSLRRVELWVRDSADAEPRQVFAAGAAPAAGADHPQAAVKAFVTQDTFLQRLKATPDDQLPRACVPVDVTLEGEAGAVVERQRWLVSNVLAGGAAKAMALEGGAPRGWVPWAGVAAAVAPPRALTGRAFCFLPLPVACGLPLHVNAVLELSSNRRDVWHGSDLTGSGRARAAWNSAVLGDGVATAYAHLLLSAMQQLETVNMDAFYSWWPSLQAAEPWRQVSQGVYRLVLDLPVLQATSGAWVAPSRAVFALQRRPEAAALERRVAELLAGGGTAVVADAPAAVVDSLLSCHPNLASNNVLTPAYLRRHLAAVSAAAAAADAAAPAACLEYCLLDQPWMGGASGLAGMMGVPLVLMADGSLGSLAAAAGGAAPLLLPTAPQHLELFKGALAGRLVAVDPGTLLEKQLQGLAASGTASMRILDAEGVAAEALPVHLPPSWRGSVFADPQESKVDSEWVLQLWEALGDAPAGLGALKEWPLVPATRDGRVVLAAPSAAAGLVEEGAFTEVSMQALSKLGCAFVTRSTVLRLPPAARAAVHPATGPGVLEALQHVSGGNDAADMGDDERDALRAFMLQGRWFEGGATTPALRDQLRALPFYRCCPASGFTDLKEGRRFLVPTGFSEPAALPSTFIHAANPGEALVLISVLGVESITAEAALVEHVLPGAGALGAPVLSSLLVPLLRGGSTLTIPVINALRKTPCVPTQSGATLCPSQCFDPRSAGLRALLGRRAAFPAAPLADDPAALDGLVALGMRTSVTPDALLEVAKQVHAEAVEGGNAEALTERAAALVAALDELAAAGDGGDIWPEITNLSFLPVLSAPPAEGLPWPSGATKAPLAPPRLVRPQTDAWLVSASISILATPCSEALVAALGWTVPPPPKVLAAQLVALGHLHPRPVADATLIAQLSAAAGSLYAKLNATEAIAEGDALIVSMLRSGATAWVDDGFVFPVLLAVTAPAEYAPHIFGAPAELLPCERLLAVLGVPSEPTPAQFLAALAAMADEAYNAPLEPEALDTALALVGGLGAAIAESGAAPPGAEPARVPDADGVLELAPSLHYNDAPWLATEGLRMVHPDVATDVAAALGVQSLRYHHQMETQTTERLPCPPAALLRQLLRAQADPALVTLADILEIADAAGCKAVDFHLDERSHPTQSVLQPGLAAFQGPALGVRLRGVALSSEELCRLQGPPSPFRLRQGTCRFGCGLLGAYTLADIVQAVAGGSFFVFDPSAAHLTMEQAPGEGPQDATGHAKQYRYAGTDLARRFADQFAVWDWASEGDAPGESTLLRLPLRTPEQAAGPHAMSKEAWTPAAALEALTAFSGTASQALLFANSLAMIRVTHRPADSPSPVLIKEATIKLPLTLGAAGQAHSHRAWCEDKEWRRTVKSSSSVLQGLSALSKQFSWLGGGKDKSPAATERKKEKKGDDGGDGSGGAFRLTQHVILARSGAEEVSKEEHWLVSVCAGGSGSGAIAADKRHAHHSLVPQAAVAARLDDADPVRPVVAHTPGLLAPLPLQTAPPLPFTVAGFFALARSGGRRLVTPAPEPEGDYVDDLEPGSPRETTERLKARFNAALLRCAGSAAAVLLEKLVHQSQHSQVCAGIYELLPFAVDPSTASSELLPLCATLSGAVATRRLWKLRRGDLATLTEGCFMRGASVSGLGQLSPEARDFMQARLPLFDAPDGVKAWLEAWGVEGLRDVAPASVRQELKTQAASGELARSGAFLPPVAAELLLFATSDVVPAPEGMGGPGLGVINRDALSECKGLPCIDMAGAVQFLGMETHPMLLIDPGLDPTTSVFASTPNTAAVVHQDFLHPELATALAPLLAHPTVTEAFAVAPYGLEHLSRQLGRILPGHWAPAGMGGDAPMTVAWSDGARGGPAPAFLLALWKFLGECQAARAASGPHWIDPLAGWALLPAANGDVVRLTFRHAVIAPPAAEASSLLDADAPVAHAEPWASALVPALLEAKALILDPRFTAPCRALCNAAYVEELGPDVDEADLLLRKLKAADDLGQLRLGAVGPDGRTALLGWLADRAAAAPQTFRPADIEMLHSAPIYPTLATGGAAAARDAAGAVDPTTPTAVLGSPEAVPRDLQSKLLRCKEELEPLYRLLHVKILDTAALVAAVLRPPGGFEALSPAAQRSCLELVQTQWDNGIFASSECLEALKGACFVTTAGRSLAAPSALYDPTVPLLAKVFAAKPVFPTGQFASEPWLGILRSLGLKRAIDSATLLDAARGVERAARKVSRTLELAPPGQEPTKAAAQAWDAARALTSHLAAPEGGNLLLGSEGRTLAETLREIAFVPAKRIALGSAAGTPILACFSDVVLPGDAALAWSAAPLLDAPPPPLSAHAALRIKSPPPFAIVAKHLAAVGAGSGDAALAAWPLPELSPQAAARRVFEYLDSEGLSANKADQIRGVPLVPVANGSRLVAPAALFVRLPLDAAPLVHELPPEFVPWLAPLKQLGLRDTPVAGDLLAALRRLHPGTALSSPAILAVSRVLKYLLVDAPDPEALAAARRGDVLAVDARGKVTPPARCVWGDAGAWAGLVPRLAAAGVAVAHPSLPPAVCEALGIPAAAAVVQERLLPGQELTPMETVQGDVGKAQVVARLKDPAVAAAVHAALEAQGRWAAALAPGRGAPCPTPEEVAAALARAADGLQFVASCRTVLVNETPLGATPLAGSDAAVAAYASPEGDRLLLAAEPGVELSAALAAGVSKLLKAPTTLPIAPLFAAGPDRLGATAAMMGGGGGDLTWAFGGAIVADLLLAATAGELGAVLTAEDAAAARLLPLRRFAARELVAVRIPTGQLRYARVAADCAPPSGAAAFRVTLELSPGKFKDVLSTEILSFLSSVEGEAGGGGGGDRQETGAAPTTILDTDGAGASSSTAPAAPTVASAPPAAASAGEAMAAVCAMLESAGVPLERDAAALMEQTMALRARVAELERGVVAAAEGRAAAEAAATAARANWQCRICLTHDVDSVMSGCGHLLCGNCAQQLPRQGVCPFCRKSSTLRHLYCG